MVSNHFKSKDEESRVFVEKDMSAKHSEHVLFLSGLRQNMLPTLIKQHQQGQ